MQNTEFTSNDKMVIDSNEQQCDKKYGKIHHHCGQEKKMCVVI